MSGLRTPAARGLVGLLVVVMLLPVLSAWAASTTVVLNLERGSKNRTLKACSLVHHYTFFGHAWPIQMNGVVSPSPSAALWKVKVKVKRCVGGRFGTVWTGHATGHKSGAYHLAFRPRRTGFYFARTYYYGVTPAAESDKQYFRVT